MMDDPYEIHVNPGYGKKRFSRQELLDILVSIIVLSVAFMVLYRNNTIMNCLEYHLGETGRWAGLFGICLNDATLVIILLAIWLLSSGGLSGYGGCGCGCNTCGGGRSGCGDCGCGCN